jgi:uncharacterized protein YsxB (DUF464 family)
VLRVVVRRDAEGRIASLAADGHAGSGPYGEDIVCAAASAVLQAARLGLEEYARVSVHAEQGSGRLLLRVPAEARDNAAVRAILETAVLAIRRIAHDHPAHLAAREERE